MSSPWVEIEENRIHRDVVAVGRDERRHLFCDFHHLVTAHALHQVEKHARDLAEKLARLVVSPDGVLKSWCLGVGTNSLDFGFLLLHTLDEGGHVMLVLYLVESRCLKRRAEVREKWVVIATV